MQWSWLVPIGLVLGTFAWMGRMEQEDTGEGWVRAGARKLMWAVLVFGAIFVVFWAWDGLSST